MDTLLVKVEFFEALFKVHHTKSMRLSYPMPLPTTVAGMFGAMFGIQRSRDIPEYFKDLLFGSKLESLKGANTEFSTYGQWPKRIHGVATTTILLEPSYLIAVAGISEKIYNIYEKINNGFEFLPYGGQNDYFIKDIQILGINKNVKKSNKIQNYAPQDYTERIELDTGTVVHTLPVMHKMGKNRNFYFVYKGSLILKNPIQCVDGIGLYNLKDFYWVWG